MPLPFGQGWKDRYGDQEISQFRGAQLICEKWGISRRQLEEFALESHHRAVRAIDEGRFERGVAAGGAGASGRPPRSTGSAWTRARAATPRWRRWPRWRRCARAGRSRRRPRPRSPTAPPPSWWPRRRRSSGPVFMRTAPIPATEQGLAKAGLGVGDIDVFEVNEAFAPVLIAWSADTGASLEKTNPNGGAIALGHPLAAPRPRL